MKIAAIQHDVQWLNREANFSHLEALIAEAARAGARLVVLSEMFSTGFAMGEKWINELPEPFNGPSSQFLQRMAGNFGVWVGGTCAELPEVAGQLPGNTFIMSSPTGELTRYVKIHPFSYSGEDKWFRAGSEIVTLNIEGVRVGLFVCYDLRFAEEFWNIAKDIDMYLLPANWPESRREHWLSLLQARAIENQAYVVGVNRVGAGGALVYSGDSRIFGPLGETLATGGDTEEILYADVSEQHVSATRESFPFMNDR
ncbi:MAG: nitrilase-related carbon-nitrogen hydrolase [Actinomycetes bacterium]